MQTQHYDEDNFSITTTSSSFHRGELNSRAAAYFNCSFDQLGRKSASTSTSSSSSSCSTMKKYDLKKKQEAARLKFEEIRSNIMGGGSLPLSVTCPIISDDPFDQLIQERTDVVAARKKILPHNKDDTQLMCRLDDSNGIIHENGQKNICNSLLLLTESEGTIFYDVEL